MSRSARRLTRHERQYAASPTAASYVAVSASLTPAVLGLVGVGLGVVLKAGVDLSASSMLSTTQLEAAEAQVRAGASVDIGSIVSTLGKIGNHGRTELGLPEVDFKV